MALGDSNDPFGLPSIDPTVADAFGTQQPGDPFNDWLYGSGPLPPTGTAGLTAVIPTNPTTLVPPVVGLPRPINTDIPPPWLGPFGPTPVPPMPPAAPPAPKPTGKLDTTGQGAPQETPGARSPLDTYEPPPPEAPTDPWALANDPWEQHVPSTGQVDQGITDVLGNPYSGLDIGTATPEQTAKSLHDLAIQDPEKFAQLTGSREAANEIQRNKILADTMAESVRSRKEQEASFHAYQAKIDATQKTIQEVANTKVDPGHMWASKTTFQRVAGILSAALGGLAQSSTGGINRPLEMLAKAQEDDMNEQRAQLGRKQNALSMLVNQYGDQYKAEQALRASQLQGVIEQAQQSMTQLDPRGTATKNILGFVQQADALRQQAIQAAGDHAGKQAELASKIAYTQAQTHHEDAQTAQILGKMIGLGGTGAGAGPAALPAGSTYQNLDQVPKTSQHLAVRLPMGMGGGWVLTNAPEAKQTIDHAVEQYEKLNYTLDALQKLSLERNGEKSKSAQALKRWETTNEQRYDKLATDAANFYGMFLHGRSPNVATLEEAVKTIPMLKGFLDAGNTGDLINGFRNDLDNQLTTQIYHAGGNVKVTTERPTSHPAKTPDQYAEEFTRSPIVTKDGGVDTTYTAAQRVSGINDAEQARHTLGWDNHRWGAWLERQQESTESNLKNVIARRHDADAEVRKHTVGGVIPKALDDKARSYAVAEEGMRAAIDALMQKRMVAAVNKGGSSKSPTNTADEIPQMGP